ncbi:MAG: hypothetical protein A3C07_03000 [Candidatus Sungbacteria bacterium RIFCSPHIGHO2_02_FULL_47_11]|uniref:Uncharacterized protein n=1 Tax=Candidatus Sungbacteria bacterium RIFCSPHIGHO2_02_FULL_47_11 TaxID=1802270 RepID=A0A1G2KIN3_9BACT|nr:MAG: hypothetical protein A3C07_03000 [Candidatus Sungbacteria bacterium RIFCSPHIGHO2_02_FULL_47_11]
MAVSKYDKFRFFHAFPTPRFMVEVIDDNQVQLFSLVKIDMKAFSKVTTAVVTLLKFEIQIGG